MGQVVLLILFYIIVIGAGTIGLENTLGIISLIILIIISIPIIGAIVSMIKWLNDKQKEKEKEKERQKRAEEERKRAEEKRKQEEIRRHKEEQERIYQRLNKLGENSLSIFESLPDYLRGAEGYLDQAEYDFSDNALSPFWESIEQAYIQLGAFYNGIDNIKKNLSDYDNLVGQYEGKPPLFPLSRNSIQKLNTSNSTSKRANQLVRKAQKNPDFAKIYEMRRTNQILIAGFNNLSEVINNMRERLENSIKDLSESINSASSRFDEIKTTIETQTEEIKSSDEHIESLLREEAKRKEREKKVLNTLDEIHYIQRKKYYGY